MRGGGCGERGKQRRRRRGSMAGGGRGRQQLPRRRLRVRRWRGEGDGGASSRGSQVQAGEAGRRGRGGPRSGGFVRSVTMDSWTEVQLRKMEAGGNDRLNAFLAARGVSKETPHVPKYNSNAAAAYRDRIVALAEGRPWNDPPVVKETPGSGGPAPARKPPLPAGGGGSGGGGGAGGGGWDDWDDDFRPDMRRNQSAGSFAGAGGDSGRQPTRSKSTQDMYTKQELEASAASKENFFARRMAENEAKPQGIPPSQGGKYVGFGSSPAPPANRNNSAAQGDVMQVVSQGFGRLSMVAASAAQSAASVVQVGTQELQSKVP